MPSPKRTSPSTRTGTPTKTTSPPPAPSSPPPSTLTRLADLLTEASRKNGQPIYLVSDEAYSRIIFDHHDYPSPITFYPHSLMLYTYAKTTLTPGQRIGYIALPPTMPAPDCE